MDDQIKKGWRGFSGFDHRKARWFRPIISVAIALTLVLIVARDWRVDQSGDKAVGGVEVLPRDQYPRSPEKGPIGKNEKALLEPLNQGWVAADLDTVDPARIPSYKETVKDSVLVALAEEMWNWQAGDQIVLTVPQIGESYASTINRVEVGLGNNRTYVGRLMDGELPYSFVITVGDRNAFAFLGTPGGSYELVGNTELAWLMPTANLDQHVDYSEPDFYIVEQPDYFIRNDPDSVH